MKAVESCLVGHLVYIDGSHVLSLVIVMRFLMSDQAISQGLRRPPAPRNP
ncbi:hypothetical protein SDC9_92711 [bioreactor metagenome]|uniref:Uncharacterized protein n=1 Tax=bioreactor metagenome TaxID=1076179 RepID=A0A644ZZ31_9ZZZZ